jgi:ribosomal protein S18 acetylase RimI-like enzyme
LFAEERGELVGFLCGFLSQSYPEEAYVHFIGVDPAHRGEGLARALYERFFEAARRHGHSLVRSVTSPTNLGSIEFRRRLGFEIEGEAANYDGEGRARVLFVKSIQAGDGRLVHYFRRTRLQAERGAALWRRPGT